MIEIQEFVKADAVDPIYLETSYYMAPDEAGEKPYALLFDALKKSGYMGIAKVDRRFDNPQVTVISPDVALLVSEGTVSATLTDGRNLDARFAVSLVFVHRDGQWKVLHGHYSVPAKM